MQLGGKLMKGVRKALWVQVCDVVAPSPGLHLVEWSPAVPVAVCGAALLCAVVRLPDRSVWPGCQEALTVLLRKQGSECK